ncbi:MAG: DUF1800 family protein [Alphaproteobacteria bacterium]|nr:DUF1800 family protein [Alphaproteobacteria bacterium]
MRFVLPFTRLRRWLPLLLLAACGSADVPEGPPLSPTDAAWLDRLTWGASPADLPEWRRLGRQGWIAAQLASPPDTVRLPPDVQPLYDRLADPAEGGNAAMVRLMEARRASRQTKQQGDVDASLAMFRAANGEARDWFQRAVERSLVRDLHSQDQLREQLAWFWFNHFSIRFVGTGYGPLANDYLERVIRPRALGRFCDLVHATQRHPAMLLYLNNAQSRAGRINENYARELLELHTMGVGSGYSQGDVQQLARVLTGLTVDVAHWPAPPPPRGGWRDGLALFDPALHDAGPKTVLGTRITASGLAGITQATELACRQPATAWRISYRLAQYLLADAPPAAVVDAMAAEFRRSDGDIAAVLRLLFARPEFAASLGTLYKDPNHYLLSAVRLMYFDRPISNPGELALLLRRLGQPRMERVTPDGWPLEAANWNASGQLDDRFKLAEALGRGGERLYAGLDRGLIARARAELQLTDLADVRVRSGIHARLAPATAAAIDAAGSRRERNMLFLSSPEFMRR